MPCSCSKAFNSRTKRAVKDFSVSTLGGSRGIEIVLLSERAENAEAQQQRIRQGRRIYDHFVIEMSDGDAERLYSILHRKYAASAEGEKPSGPSRLEQILSPVSFTPRKPENEELPKLDSVTKWYFSPGAQLKARAPIADGVAVEVEP